MKRISLFVVHSYSPKGFPFRKKTFPLIGRSCAFGMKKNGFSTVQKDASAYVGRDKKIFKNFIFAPRPLRILLRSDAGFELALFGFVLALFGFVLAGIGGHGQEGQDNLRIKHASRLKKTGKMSKNE